MILIRDNSGLLTQADISTLQAESASWPFEMRFLSERAASRTDLESDAHAWVGSPRTVVFAVDPTHHWSAARFGVALGIPESSLSSLNRAGNADLKAGQFRSAIEDIAAGAKAQSVTATVTQPYVPVIHHGMTTGAWLLIALLFGSLFALVIYLVRQRKEMADALEQNRLETAELLSRNVDAMTTPDELLSPDRAPNAAPRPTGRPAPYEAPRVTRAPQPAYAPPAQPAYAPLPQSTVIVDRRDDGFTSGLAMGEMMGRFETAPTVVEREIIVDRHSHYPHHRRVVEDDDDTGGGSPDYSSSSTPAQDDSGGGSSSYDPPAPDPDPPATSYDDTSSNSDSGSSDGGGGSSDY